MNTPTPNSRTNWTSLISAQPITNPITGKHKRSHEQIYQGGTALPLNSNSPPNPTKPPEYSKPPNPDPSVVVNISLFGFDTLGSGGNSPKPPPQYQMTRKSTYPQRSWCPY